MKTIGIIGGLGPQATMDFEARIHAASQKHIPQHENQGYPPMVTWYLRHPPMKLQKNGEPQIPLEADPHLLEVAQLIGTHADFLVIPSNTPHLFLEQIREAAGKEVLSIVDVVMDELDSRAAKRVGVLAIGFTLNHGLYQHRLEQAGISCEIISSEIAHRLDKAIFTVMEGRNSVAESTIANEAVNFLRAQNVEAIVLGCSEVPLLLDQKDDMHDLINPTQLLAEAAVKYAS